MTKNHYSELASLRADLKAVTEHRDFLLGRNVDPTMARADRYWEARWRDEAAENVKLREALKPFAKIADFYLCDADKDKDIVEIDFVVGDLRAARAAIGETE